MKRLNNFMILSIISFGVLITSCKKDEESAPPQEPKGKYENGVIISNEGVFGKGSSSISFYDNEKDTVLNDVYKTENDIPLGDVAQSTIKANEKTLIAVNTSNKVVVVNSKDFKHIAEISIRQPRYIAVKENKAYVTSWASGGYVYVVDLNTYSVIDSIKTGTGPEELVVVDNKLLIANSGGWGLDSTITVVNLSDNTTKSINIHANCPSAIKIDKNNKAWVLAKGNIEYDENWFVVGNTPSVLVQLDVDDLSIISRVQLFEAFHPTKLGINKSKDKLYYGGGYGFQGLYRIGIDVTTAPDSPFIQEASYGFVIDERNDVIFLLQEKFTSNGILIRYNPDGTKIKEYTVGIYPSNGNMSKKK
jgi:YVTN family beta-propeller protein